MSTTKRVQLITIALLIALLASFANAKPKKVQRIAIGVWGGHGINIDVTSRGATVAFDCARGEITGPLTLDGKGRFKLRGTVIREHGGPVRIDESPNRMPALYTGSVKGTAMSLTVVLTDTNETVGTYSPVRGKTGRLVKCL